ncbi:MAG: D-aminoacyl-tRNA deacylase [Bdellovibrio sp.]
MKIVLQRSKKSEVLIESKTVASIERGMVLLVCFEKDDNEACIAQSIEKLLALRIFPDGQGKMNKNIIEFGGEVLAVSQFTLSWDGKKGNRPSFDQSMPPERAEVMFQKFCRDLSAKVPTQSGVFGASMEVQISNDGPVTFSLSF